MINIICCKFSVFIPCNKNKFLYDWLRYSTVSLAVRIIGHTHHTGFVGIAI